jgi:polysaccharide export outer membrane protein
LLATLQWDGVDRQREEANALSFLPFTQVAPVINESNLQMGNHSSLSRCLAVLLMLTLDLCSGCASYNYQAASLPSQYLARPLPDVAALDLSLLAAPAYSNQQIFPGDTLSMTVVTGADAGKPEEWPVRVLDDGSVEIPMVGRMSVAGHDLQSAQQLIRDASIDRGVFRSPSVSLAIADRRTSRVSVVGAVNTPGDYELPAAQADLLSAILAAGGPAEDADTIIEVRHSVSASQPVAPPPGDGSYFAQASHPNAQQAASGAVPQQGYVTRVDLVAATKSARPTPITLKDGDVVTVRRRAPKFFHVIGLVNRADRFEIKPNESARVLDAVALAGGLSLSVADRVLIVRQVEGIQEPITIHVSLREAKRQPEANLLLADGDVVSVEETPTTFVLGTLMNTVRLGVNGSVATF